MALLDYNYKAIKHANHKLHYFFKNTEATLRTPQNVQIEVKLQWNVTFRWVLLLYGIL